MRIYNCATLIGKIALGVLLTLGIAAVTPMNDAAAQKNQGGVALMKNVDEPGRLPYRAYMEFTMAAGCNAATDCANFVSGAPVCAGQRRHTIPGQPCLSANA